MFDRDIYKKIMNHDILPCEIECWKTDSIFCNMLYVYSHYTRCKEFIKIFDPYQLNSINLNTWFFYNYENYLIDMLDNVHCAKIKINSIIDRTTNIISDNLRNVQIVDYIYTDIDNKIIIAFSVDGELTCSLSDMLKYDGGFYININDSKLRIGDYYHLDATLQYHTKPMVYKFNINKLHDLILGYEMQNNKRKNIYHKSHILNMRKYDVPLRWSDTVDKLYKNQNYQLLHKLLNCRS